MTSPESKLSYPAGLTIIRKKRLKSTNDFLKARIKDSSETFPTMVTAEEQTSGRGRGDHKWFSPEKRGLYTSFLFILPGNIEIGLLPMASVITAIESIQHIANISCGIKWPNDIEYDGKKIGGILTENSFFSDTIYSVIGFGINVNCLQSEFPPEISKTATSLAVICGNNFNIETFNRMISVKLTDKIQMLKEKTGDEIVQSYKKYLKHRIGDHISFYHSGNLIEGYYRGINSSGGIMLKNGSGETITFYSGEILNIF